jgi:hypothetical protein
MEHNISWENYVLAASQKITAFNESRLFFTVIMAALSWVKWIKFYHHNLIALTIWNLKFV